MGQMCLDLAGGPVHALVRRTNLHSENEITSLESHPSQSETETFELVPCPNRFKIMESLAKQEDRIKENIFHTSREDEMSLSCEDRKFLDTMEIGIHKNETGHWEVPLPFHQTEVRMPNNRWRKITSTSWTRSSARAMPPQSLKKRSHQRIRLEGCGTYHTSGYTIQKHRRRFKWFSTHPPSLRESR